MKPARSKPSNSSSESDEHSADIWDDTLIIRNYEESLAMVKEVVAKRLAMKTNKKQPGQLKIKTEVELQQEAGTSASQQETKPSKQTQPDEGESSGVEGSTNGGEKGASENGTKTEFKVGDYCRATYEDGVDYEAKILAVEKTSGNVLIRYVGYNNEQTVAMDDLVPSWGRKVRRKQREDAAEEAAEEDSHQMEISDDDEKLTKKASKIRINFDPNFARSPKRAGGASGAAAMNGFGMAAGMGASFMVPPPPPMPPMLECDDDSESENLSAMLMSWYMSGYYTGLYHGQKMSQKRARPS